MMAMSASWSMEAEDCPPDLVVPCGDEGSLDFRPPPPPPCGFSCRPGELVDWIEEIIGDILDDLIRELRDVSLRLPIEETIGDVDEAIVVGGVLERTR